MFFCRETPSGVDFGRIFPRFLLSLEDLMAVVFCKPEISVARCLWSVDCYKPQIELLSWLKSR